MAKKGIEGRQGRQGRLEGLLTNQVTVTVDTPLHGDRGTRWLVPADHRVLEGGEDGKVHISLRRPHRECGQNFPGVPRKQTDRFTP